MQRYFRCGEQIFLKDVPCLNCRSLMLGDFPEQEYSRPDMCSIMSSIWYNNIQEQISRHDVVHHSNLDSHHYPDYDY